VGRGTRAKPGSPVGKRTRAELGQSSVKRNQVEKQVKNSGKRNQGQTWATYKTLFPLSHLQRSLFLFEEEAL